MDYYEGQRQDLERYKRDTLNHELTIIRDDGVYREIRMRNPKCFSYYFTITTFPNHLVVTGDMGTAVFSRLEDMFDFHSIKWDKDTPTIDYRYWQEKCQAFDKSGSINSFDAESFRECAVRAFRDHARSYDMENIVGIFQDFRHDILSEDYRNSGDAINAVMDFAYTHRNMKAVKPFEDFWDYGPFETPSPSFKWICWAIADTIKKYRV